LAPLQILTDWETFGNNCTIDKVVPKTDSVTFLWNTVGNPSELHIQSQNVLPPKGAFFFLNMRGSIRVVFVLNKLDPLNIVLPIEFVQLFQEQSIILNTQVDNTQSSLSFWFSD